MKKGYVTKLLLVWVLPVLLLLFTWLLFGCYYESNDDVAISQVIRGETALAPVADLHLYFHGLASVLATLYQILPATPWYGLVLYLLLYVSLVLVYQVVYDLVAGKVSVLSLACCLVLIYWFAWQQTALLINFTRLPILLAGTGTLYAASQRKHFFSLVVGVVVVVLGWCIRPSAALLGLLVAIPGAWWLAGYRAFLPVMSAGTIMAVAAGVVALPYSRGEDTRRRIDVGNAYFLDYALYQPHPVTAADSLGVLSVANWAFGDSTVVNEQLYEQSFRFDKDLFLKQALPHKALSTYYMVREHCVWFVLFFAVSSIWVLLGATKQAKEYWLAQLAFFIVLTFIALWMKLPVRLALPLFSVWSIGTLIYLVRCSPNIPSLTLSWRWALCIVVVIYTTKLWRQSRVYHQQQVENEAYIRQVYAVAKHRTLVAGGVEQAYQYLSPFATYELSDSPVLTLMGWLTLEPSLAGLRQHMTGTRDFEDSLLRLAAKPNTLWIMHESFASYLQLYTKRHRSASTATLSLVEQQRLSSNPKFAKVYQDNIINQ